MKYFVVVFALALVVLAAEGKPQTIHNLSDYYFKRSGSGAPAPPKFNVRLVGTSSGRRPDPDFAPYQKYVACVSRTFSFERCTLCYCTDLPNLALCWDYEGERCAVTRGIVDAQRAARRNHLGAGVW